MFPIKNKGSYFFILFSFSTVTCLPDEIPLNDIVPLNISLVEMENQVATHSMILPCESRSSSNCIMLAFRVGVCRIKWLIFNPMHSHISTGWAIQRITRFYLPWEMTMICHYLWSLKMRLPTPRIAQAPPALILTHSPSL